MNDNNDTTIDEIFNKYDLFELDNTRFGMNYVIRAYDEIRKYFYHCYKGSYYLCCGERCLFCKENVDLEFKYVMLMRLVDYGDRIWKFDEIIYKKIMDYVYVYNNGLVYGIDLIVKFSNESPYFISGITSKVSKKVIGRRELQMVQLSRIETKLVLYERISKYEIMNLW